MRLFIIRHGETDENVQGVVQGWLDTQLNDNGLRQAKEAAANFTQDIDVIYSSDLQRATHTALEFRQKYPEVPYIEDTRLRERNFGDASGTHRSSHDWEQFWSLEDRSVIPNAETLAEFTDRVQDFLSYLKGEAYDNVLIVAHGGVLNRVQAITKLSDQYHPYANAEVLEVTI